MDKKIVMGIAGLIVVIGLVCYFIRMGSTSELSTPPISEEVGTPVVNEEPTSPSTAPGLQVEPAAASARQDLALKLGVDEQTIVIMLVEEKTWNNGCLGLGGASEPCTMALVSGFRVELNAAGKTYIYRTNKTGSNVRLESSSTPSPGTQTEILL